MEACGSPVFWIETSGSVSHQFHFEFNGGLSMKVVDDSRTVVHRVVDSLLNKFFSSGYPYSVNQFTSSILTC